MKVSTALDHVENGTMTLPEFQRGYVWKGTQVRGLMQSLYREYPVGGLLIWTTTVDSSMRRDESIGETTVKLLLDGQQRITSLYGVMRGHPPAFFQGDRKAFSDLYFNVRDETFEFYGPVKMRDDPFWINVTELFLNGPEGILESLELEGRELMRATNRMFRLMSIKDREIWVDEITGRDRTIDEVVEIFNRVNSGGTKLSKGDLALARVSADRPAARNELREMLGKWKAAGFSFSLDWLLRVVTTIATGQAQFSALKDVDADTFGEAVVQARRSVNYLLNLISDRLGLDHDRVLGGRYAFAAMAPLVTALGGTVDDVSTQNDLLFWYIHSFMWGRYSGSTESVLQRDLEALSRGGVDGLIQEMDRWRGTMEIRPEDFESWSVGSRFYPVLYMLSRVHGARDLGTGIDLKAGLLGKESALHVHHIFPKKRLYDADYGRAETNAIANYAFLTATSNLSVGATAPRDYFPELDARNPGVLASQWIPTDRELWEIDNYLAFLSEREALMASATNEFLSALREGQKSSATETVARGEVVAVSADYDSDEPELQRIVRLAAKLGLAVPELHHEVVEPESGEMLAFADIAWPEGVQPELSEPVAFLIDPDREMEERFNELGYRFFTEIEKLIWYLEGLVGIDIDGDGRVGEVEEVGEAENGVDPDGPHSVAAEIAGGLAGSGDVDELERRFHAAMAKIYTKAKSEAGYNATRYLQMVSTDGGLVTAKALLQKPGVSDGFTHLWERKRLDLSVEALVLASEWDPLFTSEERRIARDRLAEYGFGGG